MTKLANERINTSDTTRDAIVKMAEGNPGATVVLCEMLKLNEGPCDGVFGMLSLDSEGIYGADIWLGYKDVHGEDIKAFTEAVCKDPRKLKANINKANGGM